MGVAYAPFVDRQPMEAAMDWQPIEAAPFNRDLELAVIDTDGPQALIFPCRRVVSGWLKSETKDRVDVHPTHWRDWKVGHRLHKLANG